MAEKRLSHAYMLLGPEGPGRDETALRLAAALLCREPDAPCGRCRDCRKALAGVHPDVIRVEREKGEKETRRDLVVGQIRAMTADAALMPNEAERKVYIISPADRMNAQAQNALLKALEDPPGHACFILCAAAADGLLPTVRSRCVRAETAGGEKLPRPEGTDQLARAYLETAAGGDAAEVALYCLSRGKLSREQTEAFAEAVKDALWRIAQGREPDPGLGRDGIFRLDRLMDKTEDYLRHNVSPKQIFGMLAAETLR